MPLELKGKVLTIGVADPLDVYKQDDLKLLLGFDVVPVLCTEKDILEAIQKYYGIGAETVDKIVEEVPLAEMKKPISTKADVEDLEAMAGACGERRTVIGAARFAAFVPHDLVFRMNRMFQVYVEPYWDATIYAFRSRAEALAWLLSV